MSNSPDVAELIADNIYYKGQAKMLRTDQYVREIAKLRRWRFENQAVELCRESYDLPGFNIPQLLDKLEKEDPSVLKPSEPIAAVVEQPKPADTEEDLRKVFGKTSDGALANKLALSDHKEYRRKKTLATKLGVI